MTKYKTGYVTRYMTEYVTRYMIIKNVVGSDWGIQNIILE